MKLTRPDRDAFVLAVMNDVPMIDYQEKIKKEVAAADYQMMPPLIRRVQDDPNLRGFLKRQRAWINHRALHAVCDIDNVPKLAEKLKALNNLEEAQSVSRNELSLKVSAMIAGCTTLKMAKERLPEFEKYLPAERGETGTTNLLTINVIADLTKMGWPKDLQKAA